MKDNKKHWKAGKPYGVYPITDELRKRAEEFMASSKGYCMDKENHRVSVCDVCSDNTRLLRLLRRVARECLRITLTHKRENIAKAIKQKFNLE